MPNWEDSLFFKGQNRARKKKKTLSDEPTVPKLQASVQLSDELVHWVKPYAPSDEPTVHFLVSSDELQMKSSEDSSMGWSDDLSEDTVSLTDAQFELIQRRAKTKS
jgi:hypothetical protein